MSQLTVPVHRGDHTWGPKQAPVTLVEYGDYECPYCGQAHGVIEQLERDVSDWLRFVFRNFPLTQVHPHALQAAHAAEAAGQQDAFWPMHHTLFEHQYALEEQDLVRYAYSLGLDTQRFIKDVDSAAVHQKVRDDVWSGTQSGVRGTPTFFINGQRYEGSYAYPTLRTVLEQVARSTRRTVTVSGRAP